MAGKYSVEKESLWQTILSRQAGSDLSVRGFCAAEGISEPSFYAWRRKLQTRKNGPTRTPKRSNDPPKTKRRNGPPKEKPLFVPLQLVELVEGGPTLTIVHPLGYRIQVSGEVNPAALRQVIAALDERGAR